MNEWDYQVTPANIVGVAAENNEPTLDQHLAWCKQRALAYVDRGELIDGAASLTSDLTKHPATNGPTFLVMAACMGYINRGDANGLRQYIEEFTTQGSSE